MRSTTDDETLAQLLVDQIFPQLLHLRGCLALHASAIVVGDAAIAFLGPSGRGKSTLAASFELPLLSDDCLVVTQTEPPRALAFYSASRLTAASAEALHPDRAHPRASPRIEKYRVSTDPPTLVAPRLAAAFALEEGPMIDVRALGKREGFGKLAEHVHRLDPMLHLDRELDRLEHLVTRVPLYQLRYPRSFDALPRVRDAVLRHAFG